MGCELYPDSVMYTTGNNTITGCNDRSQPMKLSMLLSEPRYLTGVEEKRICKAAIAIVAQGANVTSRCTIVDQKIFVSFDYNRRRRLLHPAEDIRRFLEDPSVQFDLDVEASLLYQVPQINATNATDEELAEVQSQVDAITSYIEDPVAVRDDLSAAISNCTRDDRDDFRRSRRRLQEGSGDNNCIDICENVTEAYADISQAPSSVPSTSGVPSRQPSSLPSSVPSLNVSTITPMITMLTFTRFFNSLLSARSSRPNLLSLQCRPLSPWSHHMVQPMGHRPFQAPNRHLHRARRRRLGCHQLNHRSRLVQRHLIQPPSHPVHLLLCQPKIALRWSTTAKQVASSRCTQ